MIEVAKTEWQLTNVQITLDGVNEIHDAVKGVEGCFAQVCDNIDRLAKNSIDVSVRMNVSLSNIAEIQKLIEFLAKRFISHEHIYFYLFPMFNEMEAAPRELMLNIIKLNKKLYDMRLIGKKVYHFITIQLVVYMRRDADIQLHQMGIYIIAVILLIQD